MAEKTNLQQKVKVMGKLFDAGVVSEKGLQEMSTGQMIEISGITIPEIGMILEIQKNVKSNHLYSYLAEGRKQVKPEMTMKESAPVNIGTAHQRWEDENHE